MDKEVKEKKVCRQHVVFCVLVVLYVFVSLLFSLPVHAATVTPKGSLILESSSGDYLSTAYTSYVRIYSEDSPPLKFASLVRYDDIDKGDSATLDFIMYTTDIDASFTFYSGSETQYTDTSKSPYTSYMEFSSSGMTIYTLSDGTKVRASAGGLGRKCYTITPYVPMYNGAPGYKSLTGKEYIQAFLEHLLIIGDLVPNNGGSIDNPDFEDTAYAFTGFTANNKMTATWTGTTERSYLKDEDVEEYVRVSYGFAAKDAPDSIKQVDNDSTEYSTAAKSLTMKVSDLVPDDDSWFLRYVQVIPCYRQAGLGVWGDFYHGVACKVYFNQDGSIDKIVRDFPQGSGDYSYKHIFSSDKYSNEIPAPELSAISHNGFTLLNNSNNDYYVDIILESNLYGVKMEKNAGTWLPVVDTDWIYNSHYYNFADTSQIAINNDVIYIPNLFSVNPESDLVDDFKKWSSEYSSYSSLPSMSFLKRSTAARTRYVDQFLFKDNSKYSDSEQLRFSHMAESVFYVRYYNKSMVYGPWVRYKFRDGYVAQVIDGTLGGAYIDVGQVDTDDSGNVRVDENGNPIVSDNVSGRQDYDTGESDFSDSSFSLDLSDVTKFFDYLKKIFESVTGALSSFGSVVAACFGFLPGELVNALIFGICVMMFIGIIKAVKG